MSEHGTHAATMESLVWISQPFLSTFPVGGNQTAQRKLTTSTDRFLTHMLHESPQQEGGQAFPDTRRLVRRLRHRTLTKARMRRERVKQKMGQKTELHIVLTR